MPAARRLPIDDQDISAVVRLVGDAAGSPAPVPDRRRQLIEGLARLVNADIWVWVHTGGIDLGRPTVLGVLDGGWLHDAERAAMHHANSQPELTASLFAGFTPDRPMTRTYDPAHPGWGDGSVYARHVRPTGIHYPLFHTHPLPNGFMSGIGLHRRGGRGPYTPRDLAIVALVLGQIDWLHHHAPPPVAADGAVFHLSPRLREVLIHLLGGDGRKQIAAKLGVKVSTLDGYLKDLYRRLNVSGAAALLAKFLTTGE